ncbi:hypothetical protein ES703_66406 [subsurface metagenome]
MAVNCCVRPKATEALAGVTAMLTSTGISTGAFTGVAVIGFSSLSPRLVIATSMEVESPRLPTALMLRVATVSLPVR